MSYSLSTNDLVIGGGVFLIDWMNWIDGPINALGIPFPGFMECVLAAMIMLLLVDAYAGSLSSDSFMDFVWIGIFAGVGCLIGGLVAPVVGALAGGVGAVIGYRKMVLKQ